MFAHACMQLLIVSQRLLACVDTNQGVACIRIHKYGMIAIIDSLIRPQTPCISKEEKRLVYLRQNPWACTKEFPHANEIAALLSHVTCKLTAGMQHSCIAVKLFDFADQSLYQAQDLLHRRLQSHANAAIATNQNQALHGLIGARHRARTKDSAKVHQTFSFLEGGVWGREYILFRRFLCDSEEQRALEDSTEP